MTLEELNIKFTASMGGLQAQLNGMKSQLGSINTAAAKTQNAFAGIAKAATLFLGLAAVRALYQVGKSSIAMANEAVESENLFSESMRGMAGAAREWSDQLGDSLGLNAYALRKNVGVFNVMFRSMGMGTAKAYEMSTVLTELAEDMASFYNLPSEEAFTKLRAGITGETEPLKRLGILVDENTTKQYAYANGIAKVGAELTQQEKLLARYGSILQQTSTAQGDLARTINSPANQIRILNAQLDAARIALGRAFQPIQAAAMPLLLSLARAATTAANAIAYLMGVLGGMTGVNVAATLVAGKGAKTTKNLADNLGLAADAYKAAGGAAKKAGKETKQAAKDANVGLKAFDEVNKLALETAESLDPGGGGGGGGLDEVDVPDLGEITGFADTMETVGKKVRELADKLRAAWDIIAPALAGIGAAFIAFKLTGNPAIALVVGALTAAFTAIKMAVDRARQARLDKAFGDISISLDEATTLVSAMASSKTNSLIRSIQDLKERTDTAMQVFSQKVSYTKKIIAILQLIPMLTGAEQFIETLVSLKNAIENSGVTIEADVTAYLNALFEAGKIDREEYNRRRNALHNGIQLINKMAGAIETDVDAMLNAALEDGEVDAAELSTVRSTLQSRTQTAIDALEALKNDQIAQIEADLKAGLIDAKTAEAEIAKTKTNIDDEIAKHELTLKEIEAKIDKYKWTTATLTDGQVQALTDAVQAEITAAGDLIATANAEITAHGTLILGEGWGDSTVLGEGINLMFASANEKAKAAAAELNKHITEGLEVGWTPELLDKVNKSRQVLQEAAIMMAGGLTQEGEWNKAIADLSDLSSDAVDNLITAFTTSMSEGQEGIKLSSEALTNSWYNAKDDLVAAGVDFNAGITEIRKGTEKELAEFTGGKVQEFAGAIAPALSKAFASGELGYADVFDYADKIGEILRTIDYSALTEDGKAAVQALVNAFNDPQALDVTDGVNILADGLGDGFDELKEIARDGASETWLAFQNETSQLLKSGALTEAEAGMRNLGTKAMESLEQAYQDNKITEMLYNDVILNSAYGTLDQLVKVLREGGEDGAADFVEGLLSQKANAGNAGSQIGGAATGGVSSGIGGLYAIGANAGQGFIDGIKSKARAASQAASSLASGARYAMKSTLQVKSPSRVTFEIGSYVGEGLAQGMDSMARKVYATSERLAQEATHGLQGIGNQFSGDIRGSMDIQSGGVGEAIAAGIERGVQRVMQELNINLNVDGERFGSAAIRTINDTQRAAGRLLLEM